MADAVAEAARTEVDVLGSSAGASFAVAAAALTSSIRRLVLFEPPTEDVLRLLPAELHERLDSLLAAGDREGVLTAAYRTVAGLSDEEIEQLRAQPEWPNRLAAAHTVPRELGIAPERLFDAGRVRSVTVPTLVLVGGDTPPAFRASAEKVASTLPNATLVVLPGQGHGAELFAPELVAEQLLAFLRDGS